ncbi:MAG: 4Fe-4S dicluster domain-containing protein [Dysgonamonadaceae bacterium]|jgi:ferredoxin|nr:4Fe-4S dicluster domain-containing protein [Dysgonamonadaceae bacterium]
MEHKIGLLRQKSYIELINKLLIDRQVYGPAMNGKRISYRKIASPEELTDDFVVSDLSVKSFVFPQVEKLFSFSKHKDDIQAEDKNIEVIPHKVLLGVRPCDANGIYNLGAIFSWAPEDPIFNTRVERTTIISYACNKADEYCFCTSLDGDPGNTQGSDILLTKTESGDYIAEIITPKGEAIFALAPELFETVENFEKEKFLASVPKRFDSSLLEEKINVRFNTTFFDEQSLPCIGCSACAYVCPVCGCFDIQDETRGNSGQRIRCWDSCCSKLFTLHTSGHNPRDTQGARWRQRLMHKFSYMPERLNVRGCVGCGRCSRSCPAGMNLSEQLELL